MNTNPPRPPGPPPLSAIGFLPCAQSLRSLAPVSPGDHEATGKTRVLGDRHQSPRSPCAARAEAGTSGSPQVPRDHWGPAQLAGYPSPAAPGGPRRFALGPSAARRTGARRRSLRSRSLRSRRRAGASVLPGGCTSIPRSFPARVAAGASDFPAGPASPPGPGSDSRIPKSSCAGLAQGDARCARARCARARCARAPFGRVAARGPASWGIGI
jgi:hypothetical protein